MKYRENIVVMEHWNGLVGLDRIGVEIILDAHGIGDRNEEGNKILDFRTANSLSVRNTFYEQMDMV